MRNMYKMVVAVFVILALSYSACVDAKGRNLDKDFGAQICKKAKLSKIFPSPDQLIIQTDGIFVHSVNTNRILQGKFMALEDGEVYIAVRSPDRLVKRGPCGLHKVYHKACGGCGVLLCPMNCTCFD